MFLPSDRFDRNPAASIALRLTAAGLALATAWIHLGLGELMFTANAAGFAILAVVLVIPGSRLDQYRWAPRLAMIGFAAATIVGWLLFGARYETGYLATGIEVAIVVVVAIDMLIAYGSPQAIARRIIADVVAARRTVVAAF
jgi:hypothetical protein